MEASINNVYILMSKAGKVQPKPIVSEFYHRKFPQLQRGLSVQTKDTKAVGMHILRRASLVMRAGNQIQ